MIFFFSCYLFQLLIVKIKLTTRFEVHTNSNPSIKKRSFLDKNEINLKGFVLQMRLIKLHSPFIISYWPRKKFSATSHWIEYCRGLRAFTVKYYMSYTWLSSSIHGFWAGFSLLLWFFQKKKRRRNTYQLIIQSIRLNTCMYNPRIHFH